MKRTLFFVLTFQGLLVFGQEARTGEISRGIFLQEGIASWYGAEFNGRATASGEIFNDSEFTAAHPILPFGTMLRITNKQNNKTVTVRVNDRGPFVAARIIDLSRAAALQLEMIATGTAPVSVESMDVVNLPARPQTARAGASTAPSASIIIAPVQTAVPLTTTPVPYAGMPATATLSSTALPLQSGETVLVRPASVEPYSSMGGAAVNGKQYRVQVGAYREPQHAADAFEKLKNAGFNPAYEKYGDYYRVILGGFKQEELKSITERLGTAGFRDVLLKEEK